MNHRVISYFAIVLSIISLGYATWLHWQMNHFAKKREAELVKHFESKFRDIYVGMGMAETEMPRDPKTMEELLSPILPNAQDSPQTNEQGCRVCGAAFIAGSKTEYDADSFDSPSKIFHHYGIHGHSETCVVEIDKVERTGGPKNHLRVEAIVVESVIGNRKTGEKIVFGRVREGNATEVDQHIEKLKGGRYYVFLDQEGDKVEVDEQDPNALWPFSAELKTIVDRHHVECGK